MSDLASYDGGELPLETPFGVEEAKLIPGDAAVYATVVPNEVVEVIRGDRSRSSAGSRATRATRPGARSSTF